MYHYSHGSYTGSDKASITDFSVNINPLGMPEGVYEAVCASAAEWASYPDPFCHPLREALASFEGVPKQWLICTNGASDLIFRISSFIKPTEALVLAPTFSDYERSIIASGGRTVVHDLEKTSLFRVDERLLESIQRTRPQLLFLCNPNNPTGAVIPMACWEALLKLTEAIGCFVVVDECFLDFVVGGSSLSVKKWLGACAHLLIVKAFTKTFALAGLRLGYGVCSNESVLEALTSMAPDWSVSTVAQVAGTRALQGAEQYLKNTQSFVEFQKKHLINALHQKGFTVYDSQANYVFFSSPHQHALQEVLLERERLYIRSCRNYRGLDASTAYYRVGVLSAEKNALFIDAIKRIAD